MPAKNTIKTFVENGYYHIYNRGVEKRNIFLDEQDCGVFLHYLKNYLIPIDELKQEYFTHKQFIKLSFYNLSKEIKLLAFALMSNHFHLLIKQESRDGITKLMRRVITSYVMYFNQKYKRVGSLFQSIYKAVLVENEEQLLHLSRYIHLNPIKNKTSLNYLNYSSYPYYLGQKSASWIDKQIILNYFKIALRQNKIDMLSFQSFTEDYLDESELLERLKDFIFEE